MEENNLDSYIVPYEEPIEEEKPTAQDIIRDNIERANDFLDLITEQLKGGNVSGIMLQAVAKMIDSVTTAANALISAEAENWGLQLRADMLNLKERELKLKQLSGGPPRASGNNVFLGSFGELIGQINQPKEIGEEDI